MAVLPVVDTILNWTFRLINQTHYLMPHSYSKIWIHAVWSTKERVPLIDAAIESQLYAFMKKQLQDLGCTIHIINGVADHVHCLYILNPNKANSDVIKQVKGSSSHFVNQQNLIDQKFAWQTGYSSFSVSESMVGRTFQYIQNQKEHHRKKSFQEELDDFLRVYGFTK